VAVIRKGKLLAVGAPDELRRHAGAPRLEVIGSGFSDAVIAQLRARPEVSDVETQDRRLLIRLRQDVDTAPLVSMMVSAGVQVEEVRKGRASLEEVFLTLMEEEK
jgi:ABC-2 type transport system ATP-binding protein